LAIDCAAPRRTLIHDLNGAARTALDTRREAVARIQSGAAAEERRAMVRRKVVELIGGLPESPGRSSRSRACRDSR
jgi:hypothetical protein